MENDSVLKQSVFTIAFDIQVFEYNTRTKSCFHKDTLFGRCVNKMFIASCTLQTFNTKHVVHTKSKTRSMPAFRIPVCCQSKYWSTLARAFKSSGYQWSATLYLPTRYRKIAVLLEKNKTNFGLINLEWRAIYNPEKHMLNWANFVPL